MEVWTCQVDQINAPNRHVAIPNQFGHHMASLSLQSVQERSVTYSLMFFVSLFYSVLTTGKKSKVEDYSRLQESSSAKSTGMFKKSKFTEENEHLVHDYYFSGEWFSCP